MKKLLVLILALTGVAAPLYAGAPLVTETGIALDTPWKVEVYKFATQNALHVAWGRAHSERNYQLALQLAQAEGLRVDPEILFAAAFFHDIGAIEPFRKPGVEHEIRSVEVMEPLLKTYGFPLSKLGTVRDIVMEHMYYHTTAPQSPESKVFHDADALDFLGEIGIVRIVALTTSGHPWAPDLPGAVQTLKGWTTELGPTLATAAARKVAATRVDEMRPFFESLDRQTFAGKAL